MIATGQSAGVTAPVPNGSETVAEAASSSSSSSSTLRQMLVRAELKMDRWLNSNPQKHPADVTFF